MLAFFAYILVKVLTLNTYMEIDLINITIYLKFKLNAKIILPLYIDLQSKLESI